MAPENLSPAILHDPNIEHLMAILDFLIKSEQVRLVEGYWNITN